MATDPSWCRLRNPDGWQVPSHPLQASSGGSARAIPAPLPPKPTPAHGRRRRENMFIMRNERKTTVAPDTRRPDPTFHSDSIGGAHVR